VSRAAGDASRARVILLLGAVLSLNGADSATVGAVAPQLERALHVGNAGIGLLSSAALLSGAVFVLPVGMLVDRIPRVPLLSLSIVLWSVATLLGAFSTSYGHLLVTRLALGAVTATAGPAIASLTGDFFPARDRGRVYAYILGGEIAGSAAGFIVGGMLAGLLSWRASFVILAVPGLWLARTLWQTLPEPPRHIVVESRTRMGLVQAVAFMLRIRTNVLLIVSSALGYFFFTGLQTFALLFVRGRYHTGQAMAELVLVMVVAGALVGTLAGGWLTDLLGHHGRPEARILVPAVCYLGAAVVLLPGILGTAVTPAMWFDVGGAALLSAANPGLDAARLDIVPAALWGRAESARTLLRSLAQAVAPLTFGGCADLIAGIALEQAPPGTHAPAISPGAARGLEISFLIMVTALIASGVFLVKALRTYREDAEAATLRPRS
jgi:MFS family permease